MDVFIQIVLITILAGLVKSQVPAVVSANTEQCNIIGAAECFANMETIAQPHAITGDPLNEIQVPCTKQMAEIGTLRSCLEKNLTGCPTILKDSEILIGQAEYFCKQVTGCVDFAGHYRSSLSCITQMFQSLTMPTAANSSKTNCEEFSQCLVAKAKPCQVALVMFLNVQWNMFKPTCAIAGVDTPKELEVPANPAPVPTLACPKLQEIAMAINICHKTFIDQVGKVADIHTLNVTTYCIAVADFSNCANMSVNQCPEASGVRDILIRSISSYHDALYPICGSDMAITDIEIISTLNQNKRGSDFDVSPKWSKVGSKYDWPRKTVSDDEIYVLHGNLQNLPQAASKVVRIFMSSTFTDTAVERNTLIKDYYPNLRKRCKEEFDLDFQVVDMRWGVRTEASADHSTGALCMGEIEKCKEVSIGPTFVALLSHRYGGRGLPTSISTTEMKAILDALDSEGSKYESQKNVVKKWYQLDNNAVPPEYSLQPIVDYNDMESYLKGQDYKINKYRRGINTLDYEEDIIEDTPAIAKQKQDARARYEAILKKGSDIWKDEEPVLAKTIRHAVGICLKKNTIDEESAVKYFRSITEEEIMRGIMQEPNRKDRCLVFVRNIEKINLKHKKAWRFIDMDGAQVDEDAQIHLKKLTDTTLPQYLTDENLFRLTTTWSDKDGINETDNASYIKQFCDIFEKSIWNLIEKGVQERSSTPSDEVYKEVLDHAESCVEKVQRFYGREKDLEYIKNYLMSSSEQPLVIYGASGCGKTSILAKVATQIPEWIGTGKDVCTVLRFLGTTPDSSSARTTLRSMAKQLVKVTNLDKMFPDIPKTLDQLTEMFDDILKKIPKDRKVIIIADSLDQLSGEEGEFDLNWLPIKLPPHVKIIISSLRSHAVFEALEKKGLDDKQFREIESLDMATAQFILALWLKNINRDVSQEQRELIKELLKQHDLTPLYVRLLFGEISKWKSFNKPLYDCSSVRSSIQRLFRRLETKHGFIIVNKALGYLSASKNGVSELEMEDLLSIDDEVLTDVYQFHIPPLRRLPSILWARIRADLEEYIVDRGADGTKVMAWYHRQFILESRKRYLPEVENRKWIGQRHAVTTKNFKLYRTLAEYFGGDWSDGKKKPFKYTEYQMKKLQLKSPDSSADRYVTPQPTVFSSQDGTINLDDIRYNRRKLSELTEASLNLFANFDNTAFIAEHIVLDPEFMGAWLSTSPPLKEFTRYLDDVGVDNKHIDKFRGIGYKFEDYAKQGQGPWKNTPYKEVIKGTQGIALQMGALTEFIKMSYTSYIHNPTFIGADLTGRMLQLNNIFDQITRWIKQTEGPARQLCALVPTCQLFKTTGGDVRYSLNVHKDPIVGYSPLVEGSDETMASISRKRIIGIKPDEGRPWLDQIIKDIADGDSLDKITCCHNGNYTAYLIGSKKSSVVYITGFYADIEFVIDLAKYIPQPLVISDLKYGEMREESNTYIIVTDLVNNKVHALTMADTPEPVYKLVSKGDTVCHDTAEANQNKPCRVVATFISRNDELLILRNCGHVELYDENNCFLRRKDVHWPPPSVHLQMFSYNRSEHIVLGFPNGQFSMVEWRHYATTLKKFEPKFLFTEEQLKKKKALYGIPHHINITSRHDYTAVTALACTSTHFIGFTREDTKHVESSSSEESDNDSNDEDDDDENEKKKEKKKKPDLPFTNYGNLKMLFRIKGKYNVAAATDKMKFVAASRRGYIDVFKNQMFHRRSVASCSLQYHSSIDTHGQLVTNLFPSYRVQAMMATFEHQTMNYYIMNKVGKTRKYLPTFDKSAGNIQEIISFNDMAITFSTSKVHQWSVADGKIKRTFHGPTPKQTFLKCAADEQLTLVVAVDKQGQLYGWKGLNKNKDAADNVVPDHQIKPGFMDVKSCSSSDVFMLVFPKGNVLLASRKHEDVFHVKSLASKKEDKLSIKGPLEFALRLDKENAVLITKDQCIIFNTANEKSDQYSLKDIVKQGGNINDLQYDKNRGNVIFTTQRSVVFWKTNGKESQTIMIGRILPPGTVVERCTVSPDGQYMLYVTKGKEIYLRRICDGKLLAWYTMSDKVHALSFSSNSWYALVATMERRLFSFIIADPDISEHDNRVQHVRKLNTPLSEDDAVAALGAMNDLNFDVKAILENDGNDDDDEYTRSRDSDYFESSEEDEEGNRRKKLLQIKKTFVSERSSNEQSSIKVVYSDEASGEDSVREDDVGPMEDSKPVADISKSGIFDIQPVPKTDVKKPQHNSKSVPASKPAETTPIKKDDDNTGEKHEAPVPQPAVVNGKENQPAAATSLKPDEEKEQQREPVPEPAPSPKPYNPNTAPTSAPARPESGQPVRSKDEVCSVGQMKTCFETVDASLWKVENFIVENILSMGTPNISQFVEKATQLTSISRDVMAMCKNINSTLAATKTCIANEIKGCDDTVRTAYTANTGYLENLCSDFDSCGNISTLSSALTPCGTAALAAVKALMKFDLSDLSGLKMQFCGVFNDLMVCMDNKLTTCQKNSENIRALYQLLADDLEVICGNYTFTMLINKTFSENMKKFISCSNMPMMSFDLGQCTNQYLHVMAQTPTDQTVICSALDEWEACTQEVSEDCEMMAEEIFNLTDKARQRLLPMCPRPTTEAPPPVTEASSTPSIPNITDSNGNIVNGTEAPGVGTQTSPSATITVFVMIAAALTHFIL